MRHVQRTLSSVQGAQLRRVDMEIGVAVVAEETIAPKDDALTEEASSAD